MAEKNKDALRGYQPQGCDPKYWKIAKPVLLKIFEQDLERRPDQDERTMASRKSALGLYLTWLAEHEPELLDHDPLDSDEIRHYLATDGIARRSSHRSRVAIKSILMSFGNDKPKRITEASGSIAPTSDAVVEAALVQATLFRNPVTRANARALLLLARGAGLDGADLRWVRGVDIAQRAGAGTWVTVSNPKNTREVPVLARFADPLEDLALGRGQSPMLGRDAIIPIDPSTPGHITSTISRAFTNSDNKTRVQVEGLRKAWIAEHVAANAPLLPLMQAAGIKSLRSIDDLVSEHAPLVSPNPVHIAYELGGVVGKRDRG